MYGSKETKRRFKAAAAARTELCDSVCLSDAWLVFMIVGFGLAGNIFRVRKRNHLLVGFILFCLCFGFYLLLKNFEKAMELQAELEAKEEEDEAARQENKALEEKQKSVEEDASCPQLGSQEARRQRPSGS